jgi:hypothetical protein
MNQFISATTREIREKDTEKIRKELRIGYKRILDRKFSDPTEF